MSSAAPVAESDFKLSDVQAVVILTVAAIGLGDIWRLPSLALNHGGGAFLLVYAAALLLLGVPVLMAELAYGKFANARFSVTTRASVQSFGLPRFWLLLVWSMPLAGLAVISLYGALAGWSFGFIFRAASGAAEGLDVEQARTLFLNLAADPERSMVWHTLFWLCVGVASAQGWQQGILRASLWFGGLMLLLILLLADAMPLLGGGDLGRLFAMRWSDLDQTGIWAALTQACFTLSVGFGIVFVVGRHLRQPGHTARIALGVVSLDLIFALIMGGAIASVVGSDSMRASSGVTLVFVDLVVGLGDSRGAQLQFFCLMVLLCASSALLLLEPFVQSIQARFRCHRVAAAGSAVLGAWLVGLVTIFSLGPWRDVDLYGRGLVDWLVYLGVNILVPLNCLIIASFVGRALPPQLVMAVSGSRLLIMGPWYLWLRFPVRLMLVLMLLHTSGIMGMVYDFFRL